MMVYGFLSTVTLKGASDSGFSERVKSAICSTKEKTAIWNREIYKGNPPFLHAKPPVHVKLIRAYQDMTLLHHQRPRYTTAAWAFDVLVVGRTLIGPKGSIPWSRVAPGHETELE